MNPKIEKLRGRIAELKEHIRCMQSGHVRVPKEHAIAALDQHIAALQVESLNRVNGWVSHFTYPAPRPDSLMPIGPHAHYAAETFLAALAPVAFRARLMELLEQQYADSPETIALEDRAAWLETKNAELLKLEIADYNESSAAKIPQRRDLDPRVLLGLV